VATVEEGVQLRENGITQPILLLGYAAVDDVPRLAREQITAPLCDLETAYAFSRAAEQAGVSIDVHFAVETGMTRIGFSTYAPEEAVRDMLAAAALPGLHPTGIFTHFAVADTEDGTVYTDTQLTRFLAVCDGLKRAGLHLTRHAANSAGLLRYPDSRLDMVRAGIILYGYRPDVTMEDTLGLCPAMTVKARVVQVRDVPKGTSVSYGRTFTTEKDCRLAVVSFGYADGFLRTGSNKAQVMIRGVRMPVRGRICMDMCMVEVPEGADVHRGDTAVIFGNTLTAEDAAAAAGTISYEVLCAVSARIPRLYPEVPES
jgi:alanine racemase